VGGLIGLILETMITWVQPASYVSTGRMIVSIKPATSTGAEVPTYSEEMNNFLGTQAALMQSDLVRGKAYEKVLLAMDAAARHAGGGGSATNASHAAASTNLAAVDTDPPANSGNGTNLDATTTESVEKDPSKKVSLRVTVSPKTSIFVLEGTGIDGPFVRAFVDACMEEYRNLKKEMRSHTSDTTVAGMEEEAMRLDKELRACDDELVAFQSTNSLVWLQQQGNSVGNYLVALNQRLASLKSEHDLLQTLTLDQNMQRQQELSVTLPTAPPGASSTPGDPGVEATGQNNSALNSDTLAMDYLHAKQQVLLMKAEMTDLAQYLRPKHPKMIDMKEQIESRERLLDIYRQQGGEQLENRKASVALQIQNLEKDVKQWDTKILEISRKSAEYERMKANSQRIQALYDHMLATMQTLDVNKDISPESVTILEKASKAKPDRPRHLRNMLAAGFGCMILSIGLLLLIDHLDDRVNSLTELQELFDENVMVQIPRERLMKGQEELELVQPDDKRHSFLEAYRNLRSSLLYMAESGKRPRTLLLTSSIPNEGKSLTASNLAITMAQSGSRVLLVDGDLRKGLLHHRFKLKAEPGFCEVFSQGLDWQPLVQKTGFANLDLLARGATTQQSSEYFIGDITPKFIKEVIAKYDYLVMDTAPVMAADDVTSLAPLMDGVLFVLRAQHTSARIARASLELLYQRQVNVLGLIFNAVRPSSVDYYYYYKYKDYYYKDYAKAKPEDAKAKSEEGEKSKRSHHHHSRGD